VNGEWVPNAPLPHHVSRITITHHGAQLDYFISEVTEQAIRREREKARQLRASQWWKNRLAKGICHWCGKSFHPGELTMDHIVPVIRGGTSSRGNVVPSCKECNNRKKHLLPMEWEEYLLNVKREE
jgi:5-methylcytosine-specific restriction endonuclease McrA